MSIRDQLESLGVSTDDVLSDLCTMFSKKLFTSQVDREEIILTIPDNTENSLASYIPDSDVEIESIRNGSLCRIKNILSDASPTTTGTNRNDDMVNFGKHGQKLLFDTEDEARDITLKILKTNKSIDHLNNEIYLDLIALYYYLYRRDSNNSYHYVNSISKSIKNNLNENSRVRKKSKFKSGTIKPFEL